MPNSFHDTSVCTFSPFLLIILKKILSMDPQVVRNILAECTTYYRTTKKKVSQETAEDESGINFSRIEAAKRDTSTKTIAKLSGYLDVNPHQLFENHKK